MKAGPGWFWACGLRRARWWTARSSLSKSHSPRSRAMRSTAFTLGPPGSPCSLAWSNAPPGEASATSQSSSSNGPPNLGRATPPFAARISRRCRWGPCSCSPWSSSARSFGSKPSFPIALGGRSRPSLATGSRRCGSGCSWCRCSGAARCSCWA